MYGLWLLGKAGNSSKSDLMRSVVVIFGVKISNSSHMSASYVDIYLCTVYIVKVDLTGRRFAGHEHPLLEPKHVTRLGISRASPYGSGDGRRLP
jgi:hypothetical protein